jgi:16S rRNA (guanine527-N7)-methyltransferase
MPLVAPTGALVAMKGSSVTDEIEAARVELGRWGCAEPEVHELGAGLDAGDSLSTTLALRVAWADPGRVSWPLAASPQRARRKRGAPSRRWGRD